MTDQEINIAVAETCPDVHRQLYGPVWTPETHGYTTDLNAMHEVEKTLSPIEEENYVGQLAAMLMSDAYEDCERWVNSNLSSSDSTYRSTARQRAEAFLRVKGLWK